MTTKLIKFLTLTTLLTSCAAPAAPAIGIAAGSTSTVGSVLVTEAVVATTTVLGTSYALRNVSGTEIDELGPNDDVVEVNLEGPCFPPLIACLRRWTSEPGQRGMQGQIFCFGCYDVCEKAGGIWPTKLSVPSGGDLPSGEFSCVGK